MMKSLLLRCSAPSRLLALVAIMLSFSPFVATATNQGSSSIIRRISSVQRAAAVDPAITTTCPIADLSLGANETAKGGGTVKDVDSFYKCLDGIYKCGKNGYIPKYLAFYCRSFYYETRPKMSTKGRNWIDNTLVCLKASTSSQISYNSTCADVQAASLVSHAPCYESMGFCELSLRDKLNVFRTGRPLLDSVRNRQLRRLGQSVLRTCRRKRREKLN